jgi:hypothetical protein
MRLKSSSRYSQFLHSRRFLQISPRDLRPCARHLSCSVSRLRTASYPQLSALSGSVTYVAMPHCVQARTRTCLSSVPTTFVGGSLESLLSRDRASAACAVMPSVSFPIISANPAHPPRHVRRARTTRPLRGRPSQERQRRSSVLRTLQTSRTRAHHQRCLRTRRMSSLPLSTPTIPSCSRSARTTSIERD